MTSPRNSGGLLFHAALAFGIALVFYIGLYALDAHLRQRRGPWLVTFGREPSGAPAIVINQPKLQITNLKIVFLDEATPAPVRTVAFDTPLKSVPFGKVKFDDLMYLPGTVTLDLFGHEIELLPRVLIVNRREYPWTAPRTLELSPSDKLPPNSDVPLRRRPLAARGSGD